MVTEIEDALAANNSDAYAGEENEAITAQPAKRKKNKSPHDIPLTVEELVNIRAEMIEQNAWRRRADLESDYADNNQLSAPVMKRLKDRGVPPAVEPLIKTALNAVSGVEVKTRTDFVVLSDSDSSYDPDDEDYFARVEQEDDKVKALGQRLKKTEVRSGCDRACTAGFEGLLKVGVGWVEIGKEQDPYKYPIRVNPVHRNEMWWDMSNPEDRLLKKARWVVREKNIVMKGENLLFIINSLKGKRKKERAAEMTGGGTMSLLESSDNAGLELNGVWGSDRGYAIEDEIFKGKTRKDTVLTEILYRRWAETVLLMKEDGECIEYEPDNPDHLAMIGLGAKVIKRVTSRVRQAYAIGNNIFYDEFSSIFRDEFHYAPFFGYLEDRTGTPYGEVRGMIYLQDEVNSRTSKMQWLLSAVRTVRPDGMFLADDDTFRDEVGRADGDLVFSPEFVDKYPGAAKMLSIDFMRDLTQEQYLRLQDARAALFAVVGITPAFLGQTSGGQESASGYNQLIEQTTQVLAKPFDYYNNARKNVGNLLLMLEAESIQENEAVLVRNEFGDDKLIVLNQISPEDSKLTNSVQLHTMHIELAELPSTPTFKNQQLISMTEVVKSAPDEFKAALYPRMLALMQIHDRAEVIKEVLAKMKTPSSEQIQEQIDEGVNAGLQEKMYELELKKLSLKERELDIKEAESASKVDKTDAETDHEIEKIKLTKATTGKTSGDHSFSAITTAREIVATPEVVPIADELYISQGGQDLNDAPTFLPPVVGTSPGLGTPVAGKPVEPVVTGGQEATAGQAINPNTSPNFPPRVSGQDEQQPATVLPEVQEETQESPFEGIEGGG